MPTYEYECRDCGRRFDRVQSFNDEPIRVCPHCGGSTRRVIHASGVIFKGSGWYITDSRKTDSATTGSASASKTAENTPPATSGDKAPAGGDSKAPATDTSAAKPAEASNPASAGEP